jgi:hypothetical protein
MKIAAQVCGIRSIAQFTGYSCKSIKLAHCKSLFFSSVCSDSIVCISFAQFLFLNRPCSFRFVSCWRGGGEDNVCLLFQVDDSSKGAPVPVSRDTGPETLCHSSFLAKNTAECSFVLRYLSYCCLCGWIVHLSIAGNHYNSARMTVPKSL